MTPGQPSRRFPLQSMAIGAIAALCLTADDRPADAIPPVGVCYGKIVRLTVKDTGGTAKLLVHPDKMTTIRMADPVVRTAMQKSARFHFQEVGQNIVETKPYTGVTEHPPTNLQVHTARYPVSFELEIVSDYSRAADVVEVIPLSRAQREAHEALMRTLRQLVSRQDMIDASEFAEDAESADRSGRYASILHAPFMDKEQFLVFDIDNQTQRPFELDGVQLLVSRQQVITIDTVVLDKPGEPERGIHSIIPPQQSARGALRVPDSVKVDDVASLSVALSELSSAMPVIATATGRFVLTDLTEEEHQLRLRDREARGRITLQVQPVFGAMWLANPLDTTSALDATSLAGLSIRAAYGFNRFLSLEGELAGVSSGNVQYTGMDYEGMRGELTRSARLARALIGGVVRMGYRYVPMVRLGLGFQGIDNGSRFTPDTGSATDGPNAGFSADFFLSFGAGFEMRLGNHWNAGVGVVFARPFAGTSLSLETGLHLSYAWKPDNQRQ